MSEKMMPNPKDMAKINKDRAAYSKEVNKTADSKISIFIKRILGDTGTISANELMYSDAEHEDELRHNSEMEQIDAAGKSSLIYNENFFKSDDGEYLRYGTIEGVIDGKKIKVENTRKGFLGEIDGKEISKEDAKLIADKYLPIARERSQRVKDVRNENMEANTREAVKEVLE